MTPADIKAEPVGVWDSSEDHGVQPRYWLEAFSWAARHLAAAQRTYRVEFFLIDAPFAVTYRYALDGDGHKYQDPVTGKPAVEAHPFIEPLDELPPARLLGR